MPEETLMQQLADERARIASQPMTLERALELVTWLEKTPDGIVTTLVARDAMIAMAAVIRPMPDVHAPAMELIELGLANTQMNAEYWSKGARETDAGPEAVMCMEQARNAWKNAAFAVARNLLALQKAALWIPTAERMPPHGENVLFHTSAGLWLGWRDEKQKDGDACVWLDHFDDGKVCTDLEVRGWLPAPAVPGG